MRGPIRTQSQVDATQDEISEKTGKFIEDEGITRQELAKETDTAEILTRFGVDALLNGRQAQYGTQNTDLDLQSAIHATREARDAFQRLPLELRERYKNWQELAAAVERGEVTLAGEEKNTDALEKGSLEDVPGGPGAGGSSGEPGPAKP